MSKGITDVKRVVEIGLNGTIFGDKGMQELIEDGWILLHVYSDSIASDNGPSQRSVYCLGWPYSEDPPGEAAFLEKSEPARRAMERLRERNRLSRMSKDEQIDAMREWFFTRFEDPAQETPHDSEEGYIYIYGGPYDAEEELREQFEGAVAEETITALLEELSDSGFEWAPTSQHPDYKG